MSKTCESCTHSKHVCNMDNEYNYCKIMQIKISNVKCAEECSYFSDDVEYEYRFDHPAYKDFRKIFTKWLHNTSSCFERDILRNQQENLWNEYKKQLKL
ncbi:hypothetical protein [uncultured Arcobacter sp.]|uniref:hypothetical protein n=1 Tax=uncultured Arcobacter sp. TaxID=165434 RepID=UPI0026105FEB|nr:hypothetical protein [uncultured Arcobacter sp.]